ncbi:MAG: 1,4-alpha-glucan-branching enzyme [Bacteroidetes bacterium HGW-Bacteroidetes-4]|jgi:1,4-alpha-glucan branching enzyme|nr:MAG: 1,4-alpha-glucan-branching enzyme [Bacteroidetes bacterium HGW-Bacteroidetes-4]
MKTPVIVSQDNWLTPYKDVIKKRMLKSSDKRAELLNKKHRHLADFANGYFSFGCFYENDQLIFRDWLPNATALYLLGPFSNWQADERFAFSKLDHGVWELRLKKGVVNHQDLYKYMVYWDGGQGERIPAWARRVVQDENTKIFSAQVWLPQQEFFWQHPLKNRNQAPIIYEAHIGMAGENEKVTTYKEFKDQVLPRIVSLGYNTIQLMAIQEHPYYGSFGYHVSSFFAASSRFGTPEDLKALIDEAHKQGIRVIMDLVHSHAVKNEVEGLGNYDGTRYQFFHEGARGEHPAWDSYCFNYGKNEVLHFLLSNVKFWIEEYHFDGFRFDGITSMLYYDHGLGRDFTSYDHYFDGGQDEDAIVYLILANQLLNELNPNALSIAEEMSGYPGLAAPVEWGGLGFSHRLAMGIPDFWIKTLKETKDEDWDLGKIYHELTSKRDEELVISYTESHDQALVGDKTIAFRLMDKEMYFHMLIDDSNLVIDRGIALHKMIRLATAASAGGGYLNFMGNEFGHPEWIDFPREGNNWSFKYATRQWSLVDREDLKYRYLNEFDKAMIHLIASKKLLTIFPFYPQKVDNGDKVLAFSRSDLFFVFNFHSTKSYTDYGIEVPEGRYKYILGTDELQFGGFGRLDETQLFASLPIERESKKHQIKLYLPARTALVLERIPIPKVYQRLGLLKNK